MSESSSASEKKHANWDAARRSVAASLLPGPANNAARPKITPARAVLLVAWLTVVTGWYIKVLWDRW